MLDLLGKIGDLAQIENLKVSELMEKFPPVQSILEKFNLLEIAQSDAMKDLSFKQFAEEHNINIQDIIGNLTGLMKK